MSRTIHMSISVRGMLNWNRAEAKRNMKSITKNDGTRYASVEEFRNALMTELSQGHEVLPMSPACEGFDFNTGCPGHESAVGEES